MLKTTQTRLILTLILALALAWGLAGCGALQPGAEPDAEGQYASQEQALESGEDSDELDSSSSEEIPIVALVCPKDPTEFVLFLSHSWDFSPNRELEMMKVGGQTEPSSPCPFTVAGSTVLMEECRVPITNSGFIMSDDGPCDITSSGFALVSIEDAGCQDGKITMTIVESIDPDAGTGAMNCPNASQPYFPFYPLSRTTRTFTIQVGGSTATEVVDPDLTGQFMYNKEWTIHGEGFGSPAGE